MTASREVQNLFGTLLRQIWLLFTFCFALLFEKVLFWHFVKWNSRNPRRNLFRVGGLGPRVPFPTHFFWGGGALAQHPCTHNVSDVRTVVRFGFPGFSKHAPRSMVTTILVTPLWSCPSRLITACRYWIGLWTKHHILLGPRRYLELSSCSVGLYIHIWRARSTCSEALPGYRTPAPWHRRQGSAPYSLRQLAARSFPGAMKTALWLKRHSYLNPLVPRYHIW